MSDREPGGGPRARRRDLAIAALLLLVAAAIRFAYVASVWNSPAVRYPFVDSLAYHERALAILAGDWIGSGVFYQDPLYPYLLAGLYGVFGAGSIGVLLAQALLDACSVVLIHLTAREVFGIRVGVVAGVLACFYKVLFYYDALLLKAPLSYFLISLALFLMVRADARGAARGWLAAGFAFGLAALTRGNYLLFFPVLLAWPLFAPGTPPRRRLLCSALVAAGLATAILPVTLRNYLVADDFVLITSQAGQNFYIGNHRRNRTGVYKAPPFVTAHPFHEEADFRVEAERRAGRPLAASELSRFWFRAGIAEIRANPSRFASHLLRKARVFANDYEVPDNQSYAFFEARVSSLLRVPMPTFGLILPLALCGGIFARTNRQARLLALYFAIYSASVLLFYNMSRYRLPVVPVLIVFAAVGAHELVRAIRERELRRLLPATAFLAVAYPFVFQEVVQEDFSLAHSNMGAAHEKRALEQRILASELAASGDAAAADAATRQARELWGLAEAEYRRALEVRKRNERTRRALRELLVARVADYELASDWERALERALILTATFPGFAEGHALAGAMYARLGREAEARAALGRALGLAPHNLRARSELARLAGFGQTSEPREAPPP